MDILEITDEFDSETCDFSSEDECESPEDVLRFCDKITDELRMHFSANARSEDYCDDVYEDKFAPSRPGSYSYYADIIAAAELKGNNGGRADGVAEASNAFERSVQGSRKVSPGSWKCSGQWNPSAGIGPLEELFQVLEYSQGRHSSLQNMDSMIYQHECMGNPSFNYAEELIGLSSVDDDYSNFIEMIHRWNSDAFPFYPTTSNYDSVSQDHQAFL